MTVAPAGRDDVECGRVAGTERRAGYGPGVRRIPRLQIDLVEPDGPPGERACGPVVRGLRSVGAAWRPWMTMTTVVALGFVAVVVPLPVRISAPEPVVDAASAVEVDVDTRTNPDGVRSMHTGTYLVPASAPATALDVLVGVIRPDRRVSRAPAPQPHAPDPVEAALVTAVGVAPGRAHPADLGLSAWVDGGLVDPAALGVLLAVFDQASTTDLSRGRVVLALGTVGADGALDCPPDVTTTLRAAGPVDVVLLPPGCPTGDPPRDVVLHEVSSFAEALALLAAEG